MDGLGDEVELIEGGRRLDSDEADGVGFFLGARGGAAGGFLGVWFRTERRICSLGREDME